MFKVSSLTAAMVAVFSIVPTVMAQDAQNNNLNDEQAVQQLPTIVVTASRTAQPIERAIGDITVVDGLQLRESNDANVLRTLSRQPGIQMYDSGGPQTVSGLSIRGAWGDQNLVMLNGIRINNPVIANSIPWGTLNPRAFERIEVVRGSASSLWGSSAMGGAVNMVTEMAPGEMREFSPYIDMGYGSQGTVRTGTGFSGADGIFDYNFNALYARSDGFNATTKDNSYNYTPDDDGYEQHGVSGALGWTWAPGQRIGTHFFNSYISGDFDGSIYDSDSFTVFNNVDGNIKNRQQAYTITSTNQITDWWQSNLRYGFVKSSLYTHLIDDETKFSEETKNNTYPNSLSWQHDFSITPDHMASVFFEGYKERIASAKQFHQYKRNTNSFGAIYQGHIANRHHLQASIRNDRYSDYGSRTTGSLAYDFDVTNQLTIGLAGSTGFRMPSFTELYGDHPEWSFQGNPNLKPEKSRNIEAHIRFENAATSANLRIFQTKYRNLIVNFYDPATYLSSTENTDKATIRGLSLNAAHDFGNTRIYAGADFLNAKDDKTKKRLPLRARQVYRAGVNQKYDRFELGAEYMHIGKRHDTDVNTFEPVVLGGYGVVNLSAKAQLSKEFSAQIYWNNVFDKKYAPKHGYRGQGSNVFVNLSWQPKY